MTKSPTRCSHRYISNGSCAIVSSGRCIGSRSRLRPDCELKCPWSACAFLAEVTNLAGRYPSTTVTFTEEMAHQNDVASPATIRLWPIAAHSSFSIRPRAPPVSKEKALGCCAVRVRVLTRSTIHTNADRNSLFRSFLAKGQNSERMTNVGTYVPVQMIRKVIRAEWQSVLRNHGGQPRSPTFGTWSVGNGGSCGGSCDIVSSRRSSHITNLQSTKLGLVTHSLLWNPALRTNSRSMLGRSVDRSGGVVRCFARDSI